MDLLLENARIVDGTGSPWFRGHVGVRDGRIVRIDRGTPLDASAEERVDLEDEVLCPGFIDAHSHSDLQPFVDPTLEPKLRQGVTTEILGQDGFSMAPLVDGDRETWRRHLAALTGEVDQSFAWGGVDEYLDAVSEAGVAPNVATLVGHGTVRYEAMGMADRDPTDEEFQAMCDLVDAALEDGAIGFSTGLVYAPQVNAPTEEVRRLASRLAPYGRPFVAHIRNEGREIWAALDEFFDVGASEGIPLHISHFKVSGTAQQGYAGRVLEVMAAARARGIDVTADQYPYAAGNTMLSSILPPWIHGDGPDELLNRLDEPDVRRRLRRDFDEWRPEDWQNQAIKTGWENIEVRNVDDADAEGEDLATLAEARDQHPAEVVCDVLLEHGLSVGMIVRALSEDDVRTILRHDDVAVASDGLFGERPHPRVYGTYPRVIGHYVREENVLSLPAAVRKMTALPARAMGLDERGLIRPGMVADLVVFDPKLVGSPATYDDPHQYPVGISDVIVGGTFAVRDGETTGQTPGEVIRAT